MDALRVNDEVAEALSAGHPVVALESTIVTHGLPRPDNLAVALECRAAVRRAGAVPATVAVVDGTVVVGLDDDVLADLAERPGVEKASTRELAQVVARGAWASTTVAATVHVAGLIGVEVFATGGLGGVHRGAAESFDESADLVALTRYGGVVVCSGVKAVLDVPATLERLETLGVPVVALGTDRMPGFWLSDAGVGAPATARSVEEVLDLLVAREALGTDDRALVVAQPVPAADAVDPQVHHRLLDQVLESARVQRVSGAAVTPFVLARMHEGTNGATLAANRSLAVANAELAGLIAVAARRRRGATRAP